MADSSNIRDSRSDTSPRIWSPARRRSIGRAVKIIAVSPSASSVIEAMTSTVSQLPSRWLSRKATGSFTPAPVARALTSSSTPSARSSGWRNDSTDWPIQSLAWTPRTFSACRFAQRIAPRWSTTTTSSAMSSINVSTSEVTWSSRTVTSLSGTEVDRSARHVQRLSHHRAVTGDDVAAVDDHGARRVVHHGGGHAVGGDHDELGHGPDASPHRCRR